MAINFNSHETECRRFRKVVKKYCVGCQTMLCGFLGFRRKFSQKTLNSTDSSYGKFASSPALGTLKDIVLTQII